MNLLKANQAHLEKEIEEHNFADNSYELKKLLAVQGSLGLKKK